MITNINEFKNSINENMIGRSAKRQDKIYIDLSAFPEGKPFGKIFTAKNGTCSVSCNYVNLPPYDYKNTKYYAHIEVHSPTKGPLYIDYIEEALLLSEDLKECYDYIQNMKKA